MNDLMVTMGIVLVLIVTLGIVLVFVVIMGIVLVLMETIMMSTGM